jgi:hypothetical protein
VERKDVFGKYVRLEKKDVRVANKDFRSLGEVRLFYLRFRVRVDYFI